MIAKRYLQNTMSRRGYDGHGLCGKTGKIQNNSPKKGGTTGGGGLTCFLKNYLSLPGFPVVVDLPRLA